MFLAVAMDQRVTQVSGLRGLSKAHGVVAFAHDLLARSVQELSQPADAAHEEAGVDVEEDDSRVAVGVLPVGEKRGLGKRERKPNSNYGGPGEMAGE